MNYEKRQQEEGKQQTKITTNPEISGIAGEKVKERNRVYFLRLLFDAA